MLRGYPEICGIIPDIREIGLFTLRVFYRSNKLQTCQIPHRARGPRKPYPILS